MANRNKQEMIMADSQLMSVIQEMYENGMTCEEIACKICEMGTNVSGVTINRIIIKVFGKRQVKINDLLNKEKSTKIQQWLNERCDIEEIQANLLKEYHIKASISTVYRAVKQIELGVFKAEKDRITAQRKTINGKQILLVEDGSVDVDKLEKDGFYVIVYRQGSRLPEFLK